MTTDETSHICEICQKNSVVKADEALAKVRRLKAALEKIASCKCALGGCKENPCVVCIATKAINEES